MTVDCDEPVASGADLPGVANARDGARGGARGHVLHVITTVNRGGAENHLADLVRAQLAAGFQVTVAYLKGDGYWHAALEAAGARMLPLHMRFYGDPLAAARLRRAIARLGPQLVHAHLAPAEVYARASLAGARFRGVQLVVSKHNDTPFYARRNAELLPLARWVGRRAAAMITCSDVVRTRMLADRLTVSPERVVTVRYGLDAAGFAAPAGAARRLREEWGVDDDAVLFGTVARMVPQKSLDTLIEGYARLRRRNPGRDARLVLVGTGPLEASLRAQARELGVEGECVWAGFREDMPAVMHALDVFVLTSRWEGLGLVLLEAMAAARPVVASRVSAIPEVVAEGETALLFPVGDAAELAAALEALLDEPCRRRLGEAGRVRVAEFTVERMVAETIRVYDRIAAAAA